ncbi:TtgI: toluene efflux pump outer membrane protein [Desulfobacula toluolica Tol2]|uniref:TtgI: toluene efflux pump outer membrane protein n=1 Tax=Desulfobacula toluolica (strain DSM 7467 / Tol2) TaxID=651182 RepID=K0NP92_DESTT|nr:TtgI: toluene efflux pump outer membrane protein [Desulfobacula toluolica Tol2]
MKNQFQHIPSHPPKTLGRVFILALFTVFFASCTTVGPNYTPPKTQADGHWHTKLQDGLREKLDGPKNEDETSESVNSDTFPKINEMQYLTTWWETLEDPLLIDLMSKAIDANLSLKQGMAALRQASAQRGITNSRRYPTVDGDTSYYRKGSGSTSNGTGKESDIFAIGLDAGWELDLFGGIRRANEAADADLQASEAQLKDILVSITAEVALNYLDVRVYQTRLDVAQANIISQKETSELIQSRYQAGLSDELAFKQAMYNLKSTQSQLPTLRIGLEAAKNRLAVLVGQMPGALHGMLKAHDVIPSAPILVAVGVPADALRRRPDIRKAERELAAQTARIGVAEADLYPKFNLLGSIGLESLKAGDILEWSSRVWRIGPGVSWKLFDAGSIRKNIDVQTAIQEQFLLAYEQSVLFALEEVENALTAFVEEQVRKDRLLEAVAAAQRAAELAQDQYTAGLIDFSNVLDAQRSLLSFEDALALSDGRVVANLVTLYKTLGGGWEAVHPAE